MAKDSDKAVAARTPKRAELVQVRVAGSRAPKYKDGVQPLNAGVLQLLQINATKPKLRAPIAKLRES